MVYLRQGTRGIIIAPQLCRQAIVPAQQGRVRSRCEPIDPDVTGERTPRSYAGHRRGRFSKARRAAILALALFALLGAPRAGSSAEVDPGGKLFGRQCSGCHTYGKGVKVGPDLKGVTGRRSKTWLHRFIRSARGMIQSRDPVAAQLGRQFKLQQQMPDWNLTDTQIDSLLDYFASGGPGRKPADQRHAALASDADVARGRGFFSGEIPLQHVNVACSSCHTLRGDRDLAGGSLGPDLSASYVRYQDQAFTSRLKEPCQPVEAVVETATYLTSDELFALKAYLRRVAVGGSAPHQLAVNQ